MTPSSPQSVTIGTGDCRINATVLVSVFDHVLIGPIGDVDQSFDAMIFATSPPPARKACPGRTVDCLSFMILFRCLARNPDRHRFVNQRPESESGFAYFTFQSRVDWCVGVG